nr:immunoglobulin light chain junction region [Macaca mulatta]MOX77649.1 immunoglobulin light chain junction region [Macaca mulatta]MOX80300.1 immunoglobulin light chain junction region [Macaca mulatta]MOX80667.1 immunoglobulin light chain junction region [Macaca mulatta]MOX80925.1 immunoglobulin light chain junction region [Macaca mulatta]
DYFCAIGHSSGLYIF